MTRIPLKKTFVKMCDKAQYAAMSINNKETIRTPTNTLTFLAIILIGNKGYEVIVDVSVSIKGQHSEVLNCGFIDICEDGSLTPYLHLYKELILDIQ